MPDLSTTKFISLERLTSYDEFIKKYIDDADSAVDAKSFKHITVRDDFILCYKSDTIPVDSEGKPDADRADAKIRIASSDVSSLLDDVEELQKIVTGYSSTSTISSAINALSGRIDGLGSSKELSLDVAAEPTEGCLKTYVFSQGDDEVGRIDIPKDLVVTSGSIVENPQGYPAGTYIELIIANQESPVYINVKDLVDAYTAAKNATKVQLEISATNEISATIVAGSITSTELASNSVTTAKIADGNVTKDKLASDVQTAIDSAVHANDIVIASTTDIENLFKTSSENLS